ncbi:unnamed protein product [Rangifer tarandus platyrhynchus]|uniref:Uncharacterized protein n=2 Tax=Rangifer tarandus platyrhynchus TaxID=3082113 RepID=A0ABN9A115_RANTA|nr:unnamed protein product [Rangifer tarandus platyrhynchus]CAI9712095.1 unnamed protein product [Rangifer tarandus platyrhynchus]
MTPLLEAGRLWGVQKPVWGLRATEDLLAPGVPGCPFNRIREGSVELPTLMPKAGAWSTQHPLWGHSGGPFLQPRLPLLQQLRASSLCLGLRAFRGAAWAAFPGRISVRKVPVCPRAARSRAVGPGLLPGPPGPGLCVSGHELSGPSSAQEPLFLGQPPPAAPGLGLGRGPAVPGSSWQALDPPPLFRGARPPQQGAGAVWPSGTPQEFSDTAHAAVGARGAPLRAGRTLRAGHPGWRCVWLSH